MMTNPENSDQLKSQPSSNDQALSDAAGGFSASAVDSIKLANQFGEVSKDTKALRNFESFSGSLKSAEALAESRGLTTGQKVGGTLGASAIIGTTAYELKSSDKKEEQEEE